jgi:ubiquinol-cytochrome c reductase iron-sulfur subunit
MDSEIDKRRRKLLVLTTSVVGGVGVVLASVPFIKSMLPSEKAKSKGASIKVDLRKVASEEQMSLEWRGKPVWVLHRTPEMLESLNKIENRLRDPQSKVSAQQPSYAQNSVRSIKPEFFICIGLCTHLSCVPKFHPVSGPTEHDSNWYGGYFCPCHGSIFDLAGRVYKGVPAPTNLVIPPHRYEDDITVFIGEDTV